MMDCFSDLLRKERQQRNLSISKLEIMINYKPILANKNIQ